MSLQPQAYSMIPAETARIALAIFPKGNLYLQLFDTFGPLFEDQEFAALYAQDGQPAESPARLALVLILQFVEGLTDRQAADAVRTRIDWKYLLGLELSDIGFHHSVLSEFRARLVEGSQEEFLLNKLLTHFQEHGLLKAGGRQRTDSTHVLGALRAMTRLACVGETLRAALNALAVAAPAWLRSHSQSDWVECYGTRIDDARLPTSAAKRQTYAEEVGADGLALFTAFAEPTAPAWLRTVPAVETLRRVWLQNYLWNSEGRLVWRQDDNLPPAALFVSSPYDGDAHYSKKRSTVWIGYKAHLTETCDPDAPHLITHVETTAAPVADDAMTTPIHTALQAKALLPATHLVDTGYVDAELLITSQQVYGVELLGPTRHDYHWQAQAAQGFAAQNFAIDWAHQQATCPAGHTSSSWTPAVDKRRHEVVKIKFSTQDCQPCPLRTQCTRAKAGRRMLSIRPEVQYKALQAARMREQSEVFQTQYAQRAGIEGTLSQAVRVLGLRQARYIGLAKTHLQHVLTAAALNLMRAIRWLNALPLATTRTSPFAQLHAAPI
jgi:transposase